MTDIVLHATPSTARRNADWQPADFQPTSAGVSIPKRAFGSNPDSVI